MFTHLIAHNQEIALKGNNRFLFEKQLKKNIEQRLAGLSAKSVQTVDGRVIVEFTEPVTETRAEIINQMKTVFGVSSFFFVVQCAPTMEAIEECVTKLVRHQSWSTFAVRSKRSDKRFPMTSEEVNRLIGSVVQKITGAKVDLKNPAMTVSIEITPAAAYLGFEKFDGPGGMPVGTAGKVVALLSGGIDSPVAAWQVMKRGCEVIFVHFHSYPHTSKASITKVTELAKIIGGYQTKSKLYLVPFAEAQREIVMRASEQYRVLLYRRLMVRIATMIAQGENAEALVTGESIGQVASQTLSNIRAVDEVSALPIFRPLIGDDKTEIITKARRLGTFDVSIQPHDDCCSLFVPKHPATSTTVGALTHEEEKLTIEALVADALAGTEVEVW